MFQLGRSPAPRAHARGGPVNNELNKMASTGRARRVIMENKVADFFDLLHDRAIRPIESSDIKESCTASLLLMFAVIDSLSKITCTSEEYVQFMKGTGNKVRFKNFLGNVMGDHYGYYKD